MREFAFELELCAALESRRDGIVSRQLGASVANPGGRIVDVVWVEPGPAFDERTAITGDTIPDAAIEADVGTGRERYWKDAFAAADVHPEHARRVVDRAVEIGFFERKRRNGREYVRQVTRYPDWFGRLVGIENKPDLASPGNLEEQLRTDASLALVDEAILATESYVTRAHLHRIPSAIGVWRFDPDTHEIDVIREPTPLPVAEAGVEPLVSHPGRTDIAVVSPAAKARARRRLAERAYGKGWRPDAFPACGACRPDVRSDPSSSATATLPFCVWKDRIVDAERECGPGCGGYDPCDPIDFDRTAERERQTPWISNPPGKRRRQSALDRFE